MGRALFGRAVLVGALGYFVDIYDLVLFSVVRRESLLDLGVAEAELLDVGVTLLNFQMIGLLLGGILWGVLGDRRGRVSVLFGSILLYSLANIANAFVTSVEAYAVLRFLAGIGLAGELGAAITLVSEVLPKETRGYGAAIVAAVGILGAVAAALVGAAFSWQVAYLVGGLGGLALLVARFSMLDSGLFHRALERAGRRGDLRMLFTSRERFGRYAHSLLVGLPIWFVVGILVTFSPELAPLARVTGAVSAGTAILWTYVGLSLGDLSSGLLSGLLRSRRVVLVGFLGLTAVLIEAYVFVSGLSPTAFYGLCGGLGFGIGFWAVFLTNAAEQFGTDLRATVTTTAPNFVRGSLVPIALVFRWLGDRVGLLESALIVGQATVLIAIYAVYRLSETYGRDLDFLETIEAPAPIAPRPDRSGHEA